MSIREWDQAAQSCVDHRKDGSGELVGTCILERTTVWSFSIGWIWWKLKVGLSFAIRISMVWYVSNDQTDELMTYGSFCRVNTLWLHC